MPCKWMDRLACAECNEEHPTNIDGNCSEIFHRPVQWRCQSSKRQNQSVNTSIQVIQPTGSFVEWVYPRGNHLLSCMSSKLSKRMIWGDGTTIEENSHAIWSNTSWKQPSLLSQQTNSTEILQSQVTGVLQSNAGSSSSMGFFSLAYQRFTRTNLQIPEIFPFPFRISGVLRSLWCHYFTPKKNQVNNPSSFAKSFDSSN